VAFGFGFRQRHRTQRRAEGDRRLLGVHRTVPADCPIRRDLDAETTVDETFYRRPEVTAWRVRPIRPLIAANGARTEFIIMH